MLVFVVIQFCGEFPRQFKSGDKAVDRGILRNTVLCVDSCAMQKNSRLDCINVVKGKNPHSEIFYAKQELSDAGFLMNYIEDAGEFGFRSTVSERELFQQRHLGLVKAIRTVYEKAI